MRRIEWMTRQMILLACLPLALFLATGCSQDEATSPQVFVMDGPAGEETQAPLPAGAEFFSMFIPGGAVVPIFRTVNPAHTTMIVSRIDWSYQCPACRAISWDESNPPENEVVMLWRSPTTAVTPAAGTTYLTFPIDESTGGTGGGLTIPISSTLPTDDEAYSVRLFDGFGNEWAIIYGYTF